ncbi:MAG: BamA/TamA family outer membrane protein [bacterium]
MRNLFLIFLFSFLILTSCHTYRYIPEGEHLLYNTEQKMEMADGSPVTSQVKDALKKANNYYLQRRNSRVLGIKRLPVSMWFYGIASPNDSSFWGNYWRRFGQAPVIYDEEKSRRTAQQLQGLLETKGCFNSTVTFDTMAMKGKKITIGYHISATPRYIVDEVNYRTSNDTVLRLLNKWQESSPLQTGDPYDQEILAAERTRIATNLREEGYYLASPEIVSFLVDTNYPDRRLIIDVVVDSRKLQVFHINNIFIYPNSTAGLREKTSAFDTTIYHYQLGNRDIDYTFIYDKPMTIRPSTISRSMILFPGMVFRPRFISRTYNSLLNLRNFKYINIEFNESPSSSDSAALVDAHVRLINSTQQKISLSLELTNASPIGTQESGNFLSNGNLGAETSIEYQHKNIFGGAELLTVKGSFLLELPKLIFKRASGGFYDNFSAFEVGLDASLDMPVFLLPFASRIAQQRTRPHTLVSLGGSYQYRYWYERILANTSFGYTWSTSVRPALGGATGRSQHQILPIELTYVRILNLDDDFATRIRSVSDLRMQYQYSSHFIMDARYDYTYTNQQIGTRNNFSFLHFSLESAGNLLYSLTNLLDSYTDSNDVRHFIGVPFAQYVRANAELSRYLYHGGATFVARALLGIGVPYGNSVSMPYEKSFFGGGPTTMRAWQLRYLGPGSYISGTDMLERVGDLQFVLNLEERFPIASIFEGALFSDIGNVWLLNASDQYPGGEFRWNSFLREMAVGIGLGLRINVSIATLRLDFAIPLYDPGYEQSLRWRPPHWQFSQLVTNFGINYPF